MKLRFKAASLSILAGVGLALSGCGMPANPQPPSLNLPEPVTDLTAARTGDEVHLHWTMPKRTTDKVKLKGDQDVRICRQLERGSCEPAGALRILAASAADFTDDLPAKLASGPEKLLTYYVELDNRSGRSAGASNAAITAAGAAPPAVTGLAVRATADGILLMWAPAGEKTATGASVAITRVRTSTAAKQGNSRIASDQLPEQTLSVPGNPAKALDRQAELDQSYRYTVERRIHLSLNGHSIDITGAPSASFAIDARDTFPPSAPTGLAAVADPQTRSIDLSWMPNAEGDVAGYAVYRSGPGSPATRISGPAPVPAAAYHDAAVQPEVHYRYSVSAIDRDGNEGPRSTVTEESLPR